MDITRNDIAMATIGAFDPLLNELATRLANKTPRASILRSEKFNLALGVVKGFVESRSANTSMPIHVLLEKITDFSDFFSGALKMSSTQQEEFVEKYLKEFLDGAGERLSKAKNVSREAEKIKTEMELKLSLIDLATEQLKLHSSSRFRRQTVRLSFINIQETLEKTNGLLEQRLETRRNGRQARLKTKTSSKSEEGDGP